MPGFLSPNIRPVHLYSILHEGNDFVIVTIWMDNLLLFAITKKLIKQTKASLEAEWEPTNLRELIKIIEIKIALHDHSVMIS